MKNRIGIVPARPTASVVMAFACAFGLICVTAPRPARADEVFGTFLGRAVGQGVTFERGGEAHPAWAGTLDFEVDDGEGFRVFCIQLDVSVRTGDRYKSDGPVESLPNGCQIRYILDNYPGSTADTEPEGAARQMAVWHFSDGVDLATIEDDNAAIRDRALAIAAEASAGSCPQRRTEPPDLKIEPASAVAHVGERIAYRVTAGGLDAGRTLHVTLSGPAVLDTGAHESDLELDIAGAASFGVTGTALGDTVVTVELPYRLGAGTVFSHVEAERPTQRLVLAEHVDLVAAASATASWSEVPTATVEPPTPTGAVPARTGTSPAATPLETTTSVPGTATAVAAVTVTLPSDGGEPGPAVTPIDASGPRLPERLPGTGGGPASSGAPLAIAFVIATVSWVGRRLVRRS